MASGVVRSVGAVHRQVKPLLSINEADARRRVRNLYRAWVREVPDIMILYCIPKSEKQIREKIREEFVKQSHVKDIRVIDMLVIKGQQELKEVSQFWKNKGAFMFYFKDTVEPKPKDFLSKFLTGHDP